MGALDRAYAGIDRVLARAMVGSADPRIAAMGRPERLARLAALQPIYTDPALLAATGGFLVTRGAPELREVRAVGPAGFARDLTWPSAYAPFAPEVADRFAAATANQTAHARWYGDPARAEAPVVVVLHGYGGGRGRVEPLLWPLRAWRRAGLEVVFPTLPFHGVRAAVGEKTPAFPAPDPRFTNDGFRQAVWDLSALVAALRARGRRVVALAGMSLGGYTAALAAQVVDVQRLVLVVPLASLADFALRHGRLGEGPEALRLRDALEGVYAPSSALARPPPLPPDRVRVVGTLDDGITGFAQAERLARHLGTEVLGVRGGHAAQVHVPWSSLVAFTQEP